MKKIIITLCVLCAFAINSVAQKQKNDKPPTAAEMKKMMADAKKQWENMDPETKHLMDSMGIKMPTTFNTKNLDKITDKDWASIYEDSKRIVPKKDDYRIETIPKEVITNSNILAYLQKVKNGVANKLDTKSKANSEKFIAALKKHYTNKNILSNASIGLWLANEYQMALYIMGAACINYPSDKYSLNNYASMLIMTGGEEAAVPLLNMLNNSDPKNNTVLNNLAQAWFGLGDINKANQHIQSCLSIDPENSQANATKSRIEESKGNKQAAIDALKISLKKGFSDVKYQKLRTLGYQTKYNEIPWTFPKVDDGLGMGKFTTPPWPITIAESVEAEKKWKGFDNALTKEIEKLEAQQIDEDKAASDEAEKMMKKGIIHTYGGALASKARVKFSLKLQLNNGEQSWAASWKLYAKASDQISKWKGELHDIEAALDKKFDGKFGEGRSNPEKEFCEAVNKARNEFLEKSNKLAMQNALYYTKQFRLYLEDQLSYYIHQSTEKAFQAYTTKCKIDWLRCLKEIAPSFQEYGSFCHMEKDDAEIEAELEKFKNYECQFKYKLGLGPVTFSVECNKVKVEVSATIPETEIGIKGFYEEDLKNKTKSAECTISAGKQFGEDGMISSGVDAEVGIAMEVGRDGVSDYGVVARAGATVGASGIGDITIVGANTSYFIAAGGSVEVKSVLGGGTIKGKSIFR
jgi:hypothetical protein